MRNTLALVAAVVLVLGGLGWYMGWYHVQTAPTGDGHREIKIDVDAKKITEDVNKELKQGAKKVDEILHSKGGQQSNVTPGSGTPALSSSASTRGTAVTHRGA